MIVRTRNSDYHILEDDRGIRAKRVDLGVHPTNQYKEALGDGWHYLTARPEPQIGQSMQLEFEEADTLFSPWYTSTVREVIP